MCKTVPYSPSQWKGPPQIEGLWDESFPFLLFVILSQCAFPHTGGKTWILIIWITSPGPCIFSTSGRKSVVKKRVLNACFDLKDQGSPAPHPSSFGSLHQEPLQCACLSKMVVNVLKETEKEERVKCPSLCFFPINLSFLLL